MSNTVETRDGRKLNIAALRVRKGTYPGQNRARVFRDRKKEANRKACRGKW
jgi:hypothetical protein